MRPTLCPICSCPIQLLAEGHDGLTRGSIEDALAAHAAVVHPHTEPLAEA